MGRFRFFQNKIHATNLQRILLPWLIAQHRLAFKSVSLSEVQQMITAIIDSQGWFAGVSCAEESRKFPLAWTDLVTKAKTAARKYLFLLFSYCHAPNTTYPAVKNLQAHRTTVRRTLNALFESPIDIDDSVGRAVLRSVLGPGERDFDKKAVDFERNQHLAALVKPGVSPVIWESESKPSRKTVLDPIDNAGQQQLVEWIGAYSI